MVWWATLNWSFSIRLLITHARFLSIFWQKAWAINSSEVINYRQFFNARKQPFVNFTCNYCAHTHSVPYNYNYMHVCMWKSNFFFCEVRPIIIYIDPGNPGKIELASVPGRFFSNWTLGRKNGLVPIAWVIVRMRFKLPRYYYYVLRT